MATTLVNNIIVYVVSLKLHRGIFSTMVELKYFHLLIYDCFNHSFESFEFFKNLIIGFDKSH